jgi:serine/threonine-protein kinase ATR
MMQVNGVVNRVLQRDPEARKRHLQLRTFSVVCLSEECGVLEWVPNTQGLRPLVMRAHAYWPDVYPPPDFQVIRRSMEEVQTKHCSDLPGLAKWYSKEVLAKTRPCFHRW